MDHLTSHLQQTAERQGRTARQRVRFAVLGEDMMREPTISAEHLAKTSAKESSTDSLEEIVRRLARMHVSLATNLDGGRELQFWTREQVESLMAYVDAVIDNRTTIAGATTCGRRGLKMRNRCAV